MEDIINTGKEKCPHCRVKYPLQYIMPHELLCEANPANQHILAIPEIRQAIPNFRERLHPAPVPNEDEGINLIIVIGKEKCGKTTIIDKLIGENGDFENSPRSFVSPSSRKYSFMEPSYEDRRNLISGLCLADFALVVIDSSGDFQNTYPADDFLEPCSLAKAFGFKGLICCFSKMDLVQYSEEQYKKLKNEAVRYFCELGFSVLCIRFVPTAALQEENITERKACLDWYKGSTLLEELDNLAPTLKAKKMLHIAIGTATNAPSPLGIITARIHSGWVESGWNLIFYPGPWSTKLETIRLNGKEVVKVTAGELLELVVEGPLANMVRRGSVISSSSQVLDAPDRVKEALSFTAELLVLDTTTSFSRGAQQISMYRS